MGDQIQQDIVLVMEKSFNLILETLNKTKHVVAHSLLGTSINKYLECTMLINGNQVFNEEQINKVLTFNQKLKDKVRQMPRNFN